MSDVVNPHNIMSDVVNPHNKFFKETFSHKDIVADFLTSQLPGPIAELLDVSQLEMIKDSFVDLNLKHHFSDILYKTFLKSGEGVYIYILIEHKSYQDYYTAFQCLRYMVRIWETRLNKQDFLPILPVILYHDPSAWKKPT